MNRWLRRFLIFIAVIIWLIGMAFPFLAVSLARNGQVTFGELPGRQLRLFLLQERDAGGVGIEWSRPVSGEPNCFRTTVSYLMWDGEGEPVAYCQCFDLQTGSILSSGAACNAP